MSNIDLKKFFIPYYSDAFSEYYTNQRTPEDRVVCDKLLPVNMVECDNLLIDLNSVIQAAIESTILTLPTK